MNAKDSQTLVKALGLQPSAPMPSVPDLIASLCDRLKKVADKGLSAARTDAMQRHLVGLVTMVDQEIKEAEVASKITSNNAAQAKLKAASAAGNQTVTAAAASGAAAQ